jgi:Rad3-related DNA helicase
MVARDVSTKYSRRGRTEYDRIAGYIRDFAAVKPGNYMVFFPSYKMMEDVAEAFKDIFGEGLEILSSGLDYKEDEETGSIRRPENTVSYEAGKTYLLTQFSGMNEIEKEQFLGSFDRTNPGTLIGFCVMGGIFGEGIDLRAERLIGAVIVGTGLPQVCNERELFRNYFDEKNGSGFEYAYLYNGMNKVLQSAGRVIRTADDKGAILLLDERFGTEQYRRLFPQEWYPFEYTDPVSMTGMLKKFWETI